MFESALSLAHGFKLEGKILSEIGDFVLCFIATDSCLYIGRKQIGELPLSLYRVEWKDVQNVVKEEDIFSRVLVTVNLNPPVRQMKDNGITARISEVFSPKTHHTLTASSQARIELFRFLKVTGQMIDSARSQRPNEKQEPLQSIGTELERLASLKAKGLLTPEEFELAKKRLLLG